MMTLAYCRYPRNHAMLNLGRNDRWVDLKEPNKPAAKPTGASPVSQPGALTTNATPAPRPAPAPATPAIASGKSAVIQ
jgi:hypothetical protein